MALVYKIKRGVSLAIRHLLQVWLSSTGILSMSNMQGESQKPVVDNCLIDVIAERREKYVDKQR